MSRLVCFSAVMAALVGPGVWRCAPAAEPNAAGPDQAAADEFFEKSIRPLLTARCGNCHGGGPTAVKGGLAIASRELLLAGGGRGPAIVPGDPDKSLMIAAVRHDPAVKLRMPKGGKLSDDEIALLVRWVEMGAPWPKANVADPAAGLPGDWALQPVGNPAPPAVKDASWVRDDIDRFILAELERAGLSPAEPLEKQALIRRATFDLTGLPPTPAEIDAFLSDESPEAFARVVDRLLASPHYGERWARHWLDVVGFAETDGHEFDPDKPDMFRYRDYVIEALNDDIPFDQFVREHIAGDQVSPQRTSADGRRRASAVATGYWFLGDVQNVPVDEPMALANIVDRQLDVTGKAFLGLTVGCARCHDHKFDPIPTADYYGLAGIAYSTRREHVCVDTAAQTAAIDAARVKLEQLDCRIARLENQARIPALRERCDEVSEYLLAAADMINGHAPVHVDSFAAERGLDGKRLQKWCDALATTRDRKEPVLYAWSRLMAYDGARFARRALQLGQRLATVKVTRWGEEDGQDVFDDFSGAEWRGWTPIGAAFGAGPRHDPPPEVQGVEGTGYADSRAGGGDVLTGRLLSDPFIVRRAYVNYLIAGANKPGRVAANVLVFGQYIPELTATGDGTDRLRLISVDVRNLRGREARFELVDLDATDGGHLIVDRIFFSDLAPRAPESQPNGRIVALLDEPGLDARQVLAERYEQAFIAALDAWQNAWETYSEGDPAAELPRAIEPAALEEIRRWICAPESPLAVGDEVLDRLSADERGDLDLLRKRRAELIGSFPESALARVAADDTPRDVRVQIAGSPANLGEVAPRGFLSALRHAPAHPPLAGSGRAELAAWLSSPENPLTSRVIVNRLWLHHFGQGLVRTPDNFGQLGERPTHPALLDYLARELVRCGWSLKSMHRRMMLSSTYRQGNRPAARAVQIDPANRLWHHLPQRRLEAECVRDALLSIAGNLDRRMFGPSVRLYLPPYVKYIDKRDAPATSGPLDGDCRRSIYLEVRRNYVDGLLAALDFPKPDSTVGLRRSSTVPPLALALLNNEFVAHQADVWSQALAKACPDASPRLDWMYRQALGRLPDETERQAAEMFLAEWSGDKKLPGDAWRELCHVMLNLHEFLYIP